MSEAKWAEKDAETCTVRAWMRCLSAGKCAERYAVKPEEREKFEWGKPGKGKDDKRKISGKGK